MPKPIPLSTNSAAGTGFLVSNGERTWLVTCLHLFTGMVVSLPEHLAAAAAQTIIIPETNIAIPVAWPFTIDGKQRPWFITREPENTVDDVVSIRLTEAEASLLAEYGAFDAKGIVAPEPSDEVRIEGFPGLGTRLGNLMPVGSPVVTITKVDKVVETSFVMSAKLEKGYSGSAITINGKLCGINTGSPSDAELASKGLAINLSAYIEKLFS